MDNDIVARLKDVDLFGVITLLIDARQEIERLRAVVEAWKTYSSRAERDIAELCAQRDEARRMYLASTCSDDEIIHEMKRHGWDCFKENTDDR